MTLVVALFGVACAMAQSDDDPVLMTIAGRPVLRSEFEYSFNKNNADGVIDKKDLDEYVDLFINYKLKVLAAEEAQYDTLSSFLTEFATYRDQQLRPAMITDDDVEREARRVYDQTQQDVDANGGMVKAAHILLLARAGDDDSVVRAAQLRADSIYNVLSAAEFSEETFASLAQQFSDDKYTAENGGEMEWIRNGQTLPEFDKAVYSMTVGETSKPVKTDAGYHIIQLRGKQDFFPYDSVHANIVRYIEQSGMRRVLAHQKLDSIARKETKLRGEKVTEEMVLAEQQPALEAADPELKYLIQEYHDGLLLFEISSAKVWDFAEKDTVGLQRQFEKNRKKYQWDAPRFKGIAYRTRDEGDIAAVKAAIKDVPYDEWNETLRSTFNSDSILRIRAEKGIFKLGDNAIVDTYEFSQVKDIKAVEGYPYTSVFGRLIKQPEEYGDVKGLVVADYQEELEKAWVAELREKYPVVVDAAVLATVNKH